MKRLLTTEDLAIAKRGGGATNRELCVAAQRGTALTVESSSLRNIDPAVLPRNLALTSCRP
jgi:hypothetical protein